MRNFERGSVTVFLTLILIPTIIITAVLMDMSRIRLFSNQAIMAADNYAEGVLAEYDNLLKELYGVFAVTQDKEGVEAINDLREYVKTSFDPSGKIMNFGHLAGILSKDVDGFMPYKPKEAEEGIAVGKDEFPYYEAVEGANLSNPYVLGTQIGDFMRYRMFKELGKSEEEGGGVLDTLDSLKSIETDSEVAKKMENVMKKISAIIEKQEEFYDKVLDIEDEYYIYLKMLNIMYDVAQDGGDVYDKIHSLRLDIHGLELDSLRLDNDSFVFMEDYPFDNDEATSDEPTGMRALINGEYSKYFKKRKVLGEASANVNSDEDEDEDDEEKKSQIEKELRWYSDSYQSVYNGADSSKFKVRIDNYAAIADGLKPEAENLMSSLDDLMETIEDVESGLNDENISENMRKNVKSTLDIYKHLSDYSDGYGKIAENFINQKSLNEEFKHAAELINNYLRASVDYYLNEHPILPENLKPSGEDVKSINIEKFKRYLYTRGNGASDFLLYNKLNEAFGILGTSYRKLKNITQSSQKILEDEKNKLEKEDENTDGIKKIPENFEIEDTGSISQSGSISDFFKKGTLDTRINKIYTIRYALGMFSNYVDKNKDSKTSMTGYDMSRLNYMYGGEQEYLIRGSREPKENLNDTRNKILTFRSGVNLASTFAINKLNDIINEYTLKMSKYEFITAIAFNVAFRAAMGAAETVEDWRLLKEGKKVGLMKSKLSDLLAIEVISSWLEVLDVINGPSVSDEIMQKLKQGIEESTDINENGNLSEGEGNDSRSIKLDYSQFVNIMLMIFVDTDTLVKRTGNLICINVNNAINNGNLDSQRFTLKNAVTAVKGTSSVHFKFFMLPNGFGGRNNYEGMGAFSRKVVDQDTYNKMKEIEKNRYMFSVIRGY